MTVISIRTPSNMHQRELPRLTLERHQVQALVSWNRHRAALQIPSLWPPAPNPAATTTKTTTMMNRSPVHSKDLKIKTQNRRPVPSKSRNTSTICRIPSTTLVSAYASQKWRLVEGDLGASSTSTQTPISATDTWCSSITTTHGGTTLTSNANIYGKSSTWTIWNSKARPAVSAVEVIKGRNQR